MISSSPRNFHDSGPQLCDQFPATPATKETETLPTETPEAQTEAPSGAMAIQGFLDFFTHEELGTGPEIMGNHEVKCPVLKNLRVVYQYPVVFFLNVCVSLMII